MFLPILSMAQQDPLFTQYAFNQVAINPAVAGTHTGLSLTGMSRLQWSGFDGAPETHIFSAHMPLPTDNMGVGMTFYHDRIGVTKQNEFSLMYSYRIKFANSAISFGARGVLGNFRADYTDVDLNGDYDPRFAGNEFNDFGANFGAGVYYYGEKFYVGLSVPHLTINKFETSTTIGSYRRARVYYLLAGYVFDLNEDFQIKPYTNIRMPEGAPVQMDINASLIYKKQVYIGLGLRPNNSISALFEWQIENFRFGYAADFIQNESNAFGRGANEFLLNYVIPSKSKKMPNSTRYF